MYAPLVSQTHGGWHTVGVMEKFPFRFDTVPFCLHTVFHFIRFSKPFSVLPFTVLFPFSYRSVTVQLPCGMRVVYINFRQINYSGAILQRFICRPK